MKDEIYIIAYVVWFLIVPVITPADTIERHDTIDISDNGFSLNEVLSDLDLKNKPKEFYSQFIPRHMAKHQILKRPGIYSKEDWANAIDATWGDGLSGSDKSLIFFLYWNFVNEDHASFQGIDTTIWDSIKTIYWPTSMGGSLDYDTVSQGQFCAIMQHISYLLKDQHTFAQDNTVKYTYPSAGVPLLFVGGWGDNWHFGAGLTPLPDSSLLVYKVAESHPLDIIPGDIVLGYDGIPWKDTYPELIDAQLPITGWWWGSNESSDAHAWLMSAGLNWHLFDTIDIVKYPTNDTVHLSTSLLSGLSAIFWATEQIDNYGISLPDPAYNEVISYGLIDETSIGYIYSLGFYEETTRSQWDNAIIDLMNNYETTGLIIDERTNYGGLIAYYPLFNYLFNEVTQIEDWDARCNNGNKLEMCPYDWNLWADFGYINGLSGSYYDKPIAVLTGPGAVSFGDQFPFYLSHHENVKFFGKPTAGDFTGISQQDQYYAHSEWSIGIANVNSYPIGTPGEYMALKTFPDSIEFPWVEYEEVWFTRENVANGIDDVVEAAMSWIYSMDLDQDGIINDNDNCPSAKNPLQEDSDFDMVGDSCDNCPFDHNPDQADSDGDNIGDVCDENCCLDYGIPGDPNKDGNVNLTDILNTISYVYVEPIGEPHATDGCNALYDINGDGESVDIPKVNLTDILNLISNIYVEPFGEPVLCCPPGCLMP